MTSEVEADKVAPAINDGMRDREVSIVGEHVALDMR